MEHKLVAQIRSTFYKDLSYTTQNLPKEDYMQLSIL
jgi:hypothetical protein